MTNYVWVVDTDGVEYAVVESAFDPEIHTAVEGAVVALDASGVPQLQPEPPSAPAESASKAEWVTWAIASGADPGEAEASTKADLIATYGKEN